MNGTSSQLTQVQASAAALQQLFEKHAFTDPLLQEAFAHHLNQLRALQDVQPQNGEHKRHEANLAFLAAVSQNLARLSTPDELLDTVGTQLGEFMHLSGCVFADVDEPRGMVDVNHAWNRAGVPSLKQTFPIKNYLGDEWIRASHAGEAFIVHNTQDDERVNAENYRLLQVGAFVIVPFLWHGEWKAFVAASTEETREWHAEELTLLHEIADRLFTRVERARTEEALAASEEKYRTLFESIDEGFCIVEVLF